MLIEQVVVVYNAVIEFASSDQKIAYTAGSFYLSNRPHFLLL